MTNDERLDALDGIILNLTECPADQSDEFLALVGNKASRIKGLVEIERLTRVYSSKYEFEDWGGLDRLRRGFEGH